MKKLILPVILLFIGKLGFSQSDFRNGYVVTNSGDTLTGLINYRESNRSHLFCEFKTSKDQQTITYEPANILGYGFQNDKFYKTIELSIQGQEPAPKAVFCEVLVKGLICLYRFENIFFVEKDKSGILQLKNDFKDIYIDNVLHRKETKQYIGTINSLMFDCPALNKKINKALLDEKPLTKLVEEYNQCKGDSTVSYKSKKSWGKASYGVGLGTNISELDAGLKEGGRHLAGTYERANSLMIGISVEVSIPRISERFAFHSDLFYLTSKYYKYSTFENGPDIENNYVTIELKQLKVPFGFRYTFPKRKLTPYINLGLSTTIHLNPYSKWMQEAEVGDNVYIIDNKAIGIKRKQIGFYAGAGILKSINNKLNAFVEFRYEQTDGIYNTFPNRNIDSNIKNLQLFIGIKSK